MEIIMHLKNRWARWLTPVILATQEAEIRKIVTRSQPRPIVCKTLSQENPSQKRAGGVAQGVGPEFKPHYCRRRRRRLKMLTTEGDKI
jgi:hypothetical protein